MLSIVIQRRLSGTHYDIDHATGTITELIEFGNGTPILVDYVTEYEVPELYPLLPNASEDLTDASGKWTGKELVEGTYTLGFSAARDVTFTAFGQERTEYIGSSETASADLLFGSASEVEPYDHVLTDSCNTCHADLSFHGNEHRGFASCVLCHGNGGLEDFPTRLAPNAPETPGRTVGLRELVHRIHAGSNGGDLDYLVVAEDLTSPFPDNFATHSYERTRFPTRPGGAMSCETCHADTTALSLIPSSRAHPTQQVHPGSDWTQSCVGCHSTPAARAHVASQTAPDGAESCSICHAVGEDTDAIEAHRVR